MMYFYVRRKEIFWYIYILTLKHEVTNFQDRGFLFDKSIVWKITIVDTEIILILFIL